MQRANQVHAPGRGHPHPGGRKNLNCRFNELVTFSWRFANSEGSAAATWRHFDDAQLTAIPGTVVEMEPEGLFQWLGWMFKGLDRAELVGCCAAPRSGCRPRRSRRRESSERRPWSLRPGRRDQRAGSSVAPGGPGSRRAHLLRDAVDAAAAEADDGARGTDDLMVGDDRAQRCERGDVVRGPGGGHDQAPLAKYELMYVSTMGVSPTSTGRLRRSTSTTSSSRPRASVVSRRRRFSSRFS